MCSSLLQLFSLVSLLEALRNTYHEQNVLFLYKMCKVHMFSLFMLQRIPLHFPLASYMIQRSSWILQYGLRMYHHLHICIYGRTTCYNSITVYLTLFHCMIPLSCRSCLFYSYVFVHVYKVLQVRHSPTQLM